MASETSLAVLAKIEENGWLNKSRLIVYKYIVEHGPLTQREALLGLYGTDAPERKYSTVTARFSELEERGVIEKFGVKEHDGNEFYMYRTTDKFPVELTKLERAMKQLAFVADKLASNQAKFNKLTTKVAKLRAKEAQA